VALMECPCDSFVPCASQLPAKPSTPTTSRWHSKRAQTINCPLFFCMDADEEQSVDAKVRDSSLARNYCALGVEHKILDDASDSELCVAAGRESSITRGYEALGATSCELQSNPASRSRQLPPVRPPSRGAPATPKSLCTRHAAPSALELDLGIAGDASLCQRFSRDQVDLGHARVPTLLAKQRQSQSLGSPSVKKTTSRQVPNVMLPRLPAVTGSGGIPFSHKSGFKIKAGSCAPLWDVPSLGSSMQIDSRQMIF